MKLPSQPRTYSQNFEQQRSGIIERAVTTLETEAVFPVSESERTSGVVVVSTDYPWGDVRRYGADPSGTSDSTTAINTAITVARVSGGKVLLPAGTFLVTGITLYGNVILQGDGANSTILRRNATGGPVITISNAATVSRCGIRDMRIYHTGAGATDHGIYWAHNSTNIQFSEFLNLLVTTGSYTSGTGGDGLHFDGTNPYGCIWCTFIDVHVSGCGGRGFYFDGIANQLQFINCRAIDCYSHGFYSDNDSGSTGGQSIVLQSFNAERIGINRSGSNTHGIALIGTDCATLVGCYLEDIGYASDALSSSAIRISNATSVMVTGCTFNKCNYDIYADGTLSGSTVHLIGNQFFATAEKNQLATIRLDGTTTKIIMYDNYVDRTNHASYVGNYYYFQSGATDEQTVGDLIEGDQHRLTRTLKLERFFDIANEAVVVAPTGAPYEIDLSSVSSSCIAIGALTENTTITAFPTESEGRLLTLRLKQAAAGGKTITFPSSVLLAGGAFTLTTTANKVDVLEFYYSAASGKWLERSRAQGL